MKTLIVTVLLGSLAACSSDVDLTGVYEVTSAVDSMPCGSDAPAAMPPVYVKLATATIFGAEYFTMSQCSDAAGTDCSGGGLLSGNSFSEPIDGGWQGVTTSSSSGGPSDDSCTLSYQLATALLAGNKLTVESSVYSEEVANTEQLCSTDEATKRNDAMTCVEHELLTATRL